MNSLIIGSGGREHALAWKLAQSPYVKNVFVALGNAGTAQEIKCTNVNINTMDFAGLSDFAKLMDVKLTIVGPEAPLAAGLVDYFMDHGLRCFGPTKAAAQIEASKSFSKNFMQRHNIPTAQFRNFQDIDAAKDYVRHSGAPCVIKADGLAAGKGVMIAHDIPEALAAIDAMLGEHQFGNASNEIIIEAFLTGEEASFIAMVDGEHVLPLATSQDHKARDDGDMGPNTGGMGAYSPAPILDTKLSEHIMDTIIYPTVRGLAAEGMPFSGFLYAGLMVDNKKKPYVLEFNCRLGDPEAQILLMRMQSDLVTLCLAACDKQLDQMTATWDPRFALGVVLAAGGYPLSYHKGDLISGLDSTIAPDNSAKIFHAGTKKDSKNNLLTDGGRVLCVTALADNLIDAKTKAYCEVSKINWDAMYYRRDIGDKGIRAIELNDF